MKTYVRLGLGVGLMAKMAYNPDTDGDLQLVDAAHLFEPSPTWIALRSDTYCADMPTTLSKRLRRT